MKLEILFVLSILFSFPIVSAAIEFDMKTNFSQGETLLAKISGNFFKPITEDNIKFFRNHVRISIIPFVENIDGDFYIYAQLSGKNPNNYSILVENAEYYEGNQIIKSDLRKNFTITENISDFSIEQGFIFTEEDFSIQVQNIQNSEITINYKVLNESELSSSGGFFESLFGGSSEGENSINLKTGETKKIDFEINAFESFTIQKIQLSTENTIYQIPIYINTEIEGLTKSTESNASTGKKIRFEPNKLDIVLPLNSKTTRIVHLFNLAEENLEDLELTFSDSLKPYFSISPEIISSINENSNERIELTFTSNNIEEFIEGQIRAKTSDDFYSTISVTLSFIENYQPLPEDDVTIQTCQEIGGVVCQLNQECQGSTEVTRDGICCLNTCREIEKSSTGKVIGWLVILSVILLLVWFYLKKYKGVRNVVDLLKIAKAKFRR